MEEDCFVVYSPLRTNSFAIGTWRNLFLVRGPNVGRRGIVGARTGTETLIFREQ